MEQFQFAVPAWNVRLEPGALASVPGLMGQSGWKRALVLSTAGRAEQVQMLVHHLGGLHAATFAGARAHVPAQTVREAFALAVDAKVDCSITLGGGSATGLGKALRLELGLPQIAVPTTYAGSEMTPLWGITEDGAKRTGRDPRVAATAVVYDPDLLVSLPAPVAGPSGMNAMAQAIAGLLDEKAGPLTRMFAREALSILGSHLPAVIAQPADREAQGAMLYGACLAGMTLATCNTGLHHKLCHVMGGMFDLNHADTHAILLPYSVAFARAVQPDGVTRIAEALDVPDAAAEIHRFLKTLCPHTSLRELGLTPDDLDQASERTAEALDDPAISAETIRAVLQDAFDGKSSAVSG